MFKSIILSAVIALGAQSLALASQQDGPTEWKANDGFAATQVTVDPHDGLPDYVENLLNVCRQSQYMPANTVQYRANLFACRPLGPEKTLCYLQNCDYRVAGQNH